MSRRIPSVLLAFIILLATSVFAMGASRIEIAAAETASPSFSATATVSRQIGVDGDGNPTWQVRTTGIALGTAIDGLEDGDKITVDLQTTGLITMVQARLCKGESAGVEVKYASTTDMNPTQGGKCVLNPFGKMTANSAEKEVVAPFKRESIELIVGVGTDTYFKQSGAQTTVQCGPAFTDDCKLVLKVLTQDTNEFISYRLNYASQVEPPGAPTAVKVAASNPASGGATVSWTAPSSTGGVTATISGYTAKAFDAAGTATAFTCVTATTSCTVTGLTNSTPYTFKVKAKNSADYESGDSAASAVFLPGGTRFTAVNPTVALNTATAPASPIAANGGTKTVTLGTGQGVASGATAVVLNVTVSGSTAAGKITVYPAGVTKPSAEHLNFTAAAEVSNQVVVPLGAGANAGKIVLHNSATSTAQLVVHVVGYYKPDTGTYFTATNKRALQTSTAPATPLAAAETRTIQIGGTTTPALGIPGAATAVVLNVTATSATASGYLTVFPKGGIKPGVKSVNFTAGKISTNLVTVAVGTGLANGGGISIYNSAGSTNVTVDVVGYYSSVATGSRFFPLNPTRTANTVDGTGGVTVGKIATGTSQSFRVASRSTVPASGVKSVVYNLTMSGQTATATMQTYPQGGVRLYNSLTGYANTPVSLCGISLLGYTSPALGGLSVYNFGGSANAAVDLAGYFS
jgi:hypothetical protein